VRVAVLQSNYLPWKGYFDIIHDVDLFVFYDDVQYTKGDWRNRNRIKTPGGVHWLTIPVGAPDHRRICDVELPRGNWAAKHWRRIAAHYRSAPHFATYAPFFADVYQRMGWRTLSDLNQFLVERIARDFLGIPTEIKDSRPFAARGRRLERLLDLLVKVGATTYVSGAAARAYLDEPLLAAAGIAVEWKDYGGYPEYPQLHPPFVHQVSIIDLLFHLGPAAGEYIWGRRAVEQPAGLPS
jgi:hypothetical protein